jgi:MFS family permease
VLIAGAYFMENLDATIIAPAAPAIAESLGVEAVQINVAMTAYLLTVAVLIPASGWLSDRYGARGIFSLAIAVFTVASVGCAVAPTLTALTIARVFQGIGGAMMVPVGRLIVLRTTAKSELIKAIAYLTWPALVAPVLAPPLGGLISTYTSWRWIFLINVPLGIIGLLLARKLVPDVRATERRRLDWRGFLLTAFGVAALVIGL